ncbi:hypothetical protein THAOC_05081, partial [Thalassiosira oceanica]
PVPSPPGRAGGAPVAPDAAQPAPGPAVRGDEGTPEGGGDGRRRGVPPRPPHDAGRTPREDEAEARVPVLRGGGGRLIRDAPTLGVVERDKPNSITRENLNDTRKSFD